MLATHCAVQKNRDTKAELNRRSRARESLTDTGISRRVKMVEHLGIAPSIPAWKGLADGHQRVSLNTYARKMESRAGVTPA